MLTWGLASSPAIAQIQLPPEVAEHGYADMIVLNGKIVSVDDARHNTTPGTIYEAMAVKGDRIVALGTSERIRSLANAKTKVIDLQGQLVIPGIIESHSHLFGNAQMGVQMGLRSPDKGINVSVEAGKDLESTRKIIEDTLKDALKKVPPDNESWVMLTVRPNDKEHVSRYELRDWWLYRDIEPLNRLDALAPNNPVLAGMGMRDNLNTKGMELVEKYIPGYADFIKLSLAGDERTLTGVE
ncbi:MAG: amidohydrolase family protein [Acidobacteria bacterium]|nr:amidohydrolase family protein [Acidobacteriota bacterium]